MPEKKLRVKHDIVKAHAKSKSSTIWMITTLALAILLIVSIVTNGFGIVKPSVKSLVKDVTTLKDSTTDSSLKTVLLNIETVLTPFKPVTAVFTSAIFQASPKSQLSVPPAPPLYPLYPR